MHDLELAVQVPEDTEYTGEIVDMSSWWMSGFIPSGGSIPPRSRLRENWSILVSLVYRTSWCLVLVVAINQ